MDYINLSTMQYPYTRKQMKLDNKNVSFSWPVPVELYEQFNIAPVTQLTRPTELIDEAVETAQLKSAPELIEGEWVRGWDIIQFSEGKLAKIAADAEAQAINAIASRRYEAEVHGIDVNGIAVQTDRQSRGTMADAVRFLEVAPDGQTVAWKTADGSFTQLTIDQLKGLIFAVGDHVRACYLKEEGLRAHLEAGTYTPDMLNTGWPNIDDSVWQPEGIPQP